MVGCPAVVAVSGDQIAATEAGSWYSFLNHCLGDQELKLVSLVLLLQVLQPAERVKSATIRPVLQ